MMERRILNHMIMNMAMIIQRHHAQKTETYTPEMSENY